MKRELLIHSHGCETPSSRHGRGTAYHEDCHLKSKSRRRNSSRTSLDCLEPSSCLPLIHSRPFKRASDPIRCSSGSLPLFDVLTPARPAFTELPDSTFSLVLLGKRRSFCCAVIWWRKALRGQRQMSSDEEEWRQESLQMWEFMVRLEGFSTARAANCLSKLFRAHYDTMNVLKLVTKHDLVVDAGLKPGDALRIVVAAKDYKPPHSGKPKRQPKRPVESIALTDSSEPASKKRANFIQTTLDV